MAELKIVIIENEAATARNLAHMLQSIDDSINVMVSLPAVKDAVSWFTANSNYDLIFMDISLADGMSFEIFKKTAITRPVIFVTAYNEHALTAFKNNGIDYILKPFDEQELTTALNKYRGLVSQPVSSANATADVERLLEQLHKLSNPYKRSFLVHFREKLIPVEAIKIAWFYTANEIVYARTTDDRQYVMDFTMEQLEQQLDPQQFFRANRQFIINRKAVTEVDFYFNGRLSIKVQPQPNEQILVSKARVPDYKVWMNQ
ncbi:LytR/AlgR family response regulator transcription factor [Mucilaginibacter psychrotolerans]|uniref:Response regulator transcription factor n=1 Tax=Mucilaginibacter psychrotolerans TaxID=1524096 RepID=A0A4Y8RXG8_9SPHI|nr:LytTR family DNA-binding domain-containing protein [Mucilaginibacter psychrotolerans]TFF30402.1 response regulator transcription factor [Mucilaginibacter psychrotolerans]